MNSLNETIEARRKRLLWRASHRGMREMDLLLGGFARTHLDRLTERELDEFETIVGLPDRELMGWILGDHPVPQLQATSTLRALLTYRP
jgi:antitoxin CptB